MTTEENLPLVEQCDGWCHDEGTGDCTRCESGDPYQMCDDCNAYAAIGRADEIAAEETA